MIKKFIINVEILLIGVTGVDIDIIKKIPNVDRKPYRRVGLLHTILALSFFICCFKLGEILSPFSNVGLLLLCFLTSALVFYFQKLATRRLIASNNWDAKLSFILVEALICICIIFGISLPLLNDKVVSDREKVQSNWDLLYNYESAISQDRQLILGSDRTPNPIPQKILLLKGYFFDYISHNRDFISLADSAIRKFPFNDASATEIANQVKVASKANNYAGKLYVNSAFVSKTKTFYYNDEKDYRVINSPTTKQILDTLNSITALESNIENFFYEYAHGKTTFADQLIILSQYLDKTTSFISIAIFCLLMTLILYLYSIVNNCKNDFYHKLLSDKQKLKEEILNIEREKIAEDFILQSQIKRTNKVFQRQELNDYNAQQSDIFSDDQIEDESVSEIFEAAIKEEILEHYDRALYFVNKAIELDDEKFSADNGYKQNPSLYELRWRLLSNLKRPEEAKAALERFVELNSEKKYQFNITREIWLSKVEIENLKFYGKFQWSFKPNINILLGKNGYGKSHLLRLLVALLYDDKTKIREWIAPASAPDARVKLYISGDLPINDKKIAGLENDIQALLINQNDIQKKLSGINGGKSHDSININSEGNKELLDKLDDINAKIVVKLQLIDAEQRRVLASKDGITSNFGRIPLLAIPDTRFIDQSESAINNSKTSSQDLKRDGGTEFLYCRPFSEIIKKGLFIVAQNNSTDFNKEPYNLIERVISNLADYGLENKETNVTTDRFFKFVRIETVSATGDYRFFVRSEESSEEFELQKISQGTFSVLTICLMIYRFLSELRPSSKNALLEKAIIFIDEIDAHLHPSWEQKIIGILRSEFPNVQFIITAHSPLIVAGCLEGEVSVLRHLKDGFTLEQIKENFIGITSGDIYNKIFEIEDMDEQYLKYSLYQDHIIRELELKKEKLTQIQVQRTLSDEEIKELDKSLTELNKINSAKRVMAEKTDVLFNEGETQMLKMEVEKLKKEIVGLKNKNDNN